MAILESILGKLFSNSKEVMTEDTVLGTNQSWTDVTSSRSASVEYTNDTGKPISVFILSALVSVEVYYVLKVGTNTVDMYRLNTIDQKRGSVRAIIPAGATYSLINTSGTAIGLWMELR